MLIKSALLFLILAIIGGVYLLSRVLRDKMPPQKVAAVHGILAATGVVLLISYAWFAESKPTLSIILLVGAALGGLTMLYRQMTGQAIPKWMAIGHGLTALIGFAALIIHVLQ